MVLGVFHPGAVTPYALHVILNTLRGHRQTYQAPCITKTSQRLNDNLSLWEMIAISNYIISTSVLIQISHQHQLGDSSLPRPDQTYHLSDEMKRFLSLSQDVLTSVPQHFNFCKFEDADGDTIYISHTLDISSNITGSVTIETYHFHFLLRCHRFF